MRLYLTSLCTHRNKWYIDISITFFFHRLCVPPSPPSSPSPPSPLSLNLQRCRVRSCFSFFFLLICSCYCVCAWFYFFFFLSLVSVECAPLSLAFFHAIMYYYCLPVDLLRANDAFAEWKFMQIKRIAVMNVLKIFFVVVVVAESDFRKRVSWTALAFTPSTPPKSSFMCKYRAHR